MKKLSGLSKKSSTNLLDDLSVPDLGDMSNQEIANAINSALLEPLQVFDTLDQSTMELDVEDDGEVLEVCVVRERGHFLAPCIFLFIYYINYSVFY